MSTKAPIIPTDSPSVFAQLSKLDAAAIVRPNNPPPGIAGFLFHVDGDQMFRLRSMITSHGLEDNTMVQDAIALLPEEVSVKGLIAELTDAGSKPDAAAAPPQPLPIFPGLFPPFAAAAGLNFGKRIGPFSLAVDATLLPGGRLGASLDVGGSIGPFSADAIVSTATKELGGVLPGSAAVQGAVAAAVRNAVGPILGGLAPRSGAIAASIQSAVGNVVGPLLTPNVGSLITKSVNASLGTTLGSNPSPGASATSSLYKYFTDKAPPSKGEAQANAVGYFYQMWLGRQLFSVETPWGIINNMAILSGDFEQPEETKSQTAFTITFQKIRIATTVTVNLGQLAGRNAVQASAASPAQGGTAGQTPATPAQARSWLSWLKGGGP